MARPTLTDVRNLTDFTTTYDWYIQITKAPTTVSGIDGDKLNFRCISVDIPKRTSTALQARIRGLPPVWQPGPNIPVGQSTIVLYSTNDLYILKSVIADWEEQIYAQNTGVAQTKLDVEASVRLVLQNRQHQDILAYNLIGVWLEDKDLGQLQNTEGDLMQTTLTLRYDDFTIEKIATSTLSN